MSTLVGIPIVRSSRQRANGATGPALNQSATSLAEIAGSQVGPVAGVQPLVVPVALVPIVLELALQRAQADAEQRRRLRAVAAGARQRLQDGLALDRLHRARRALGDLDRGLAPQRAAAVVQLARQVLDGDDLAV